MRSFAAGAAASLGVVAFMNARVLMFAAGYSRMRRDLPELFDGPRAAAAVASIIDSEADLYL